MINIEALTLPLAIVGITEFVKLAGAQFGFKVTGVVTIVIAVIAAVALTFVDFNSEIIQNIYVAVQAVGGLTFAQKVASNIGGK